MIDIKIISKPKKSAEGGSASRGIITPSGASGDVKHATKADIADIARNLDPNSSDWETIKRIADNSGLTLDEAKEYFLSKKEDDTAAGNIEFEKDITIKGKGYADELLSSEYTGEGFFDTGYRLWYENGRAKLVIDDLVARGKFSVYNLESRIMTFIGGDVVFSGAGSKLFYVEYLDENDAPIGYTTINSPWMLRGKMLLGGISGLAAWSNRRRIQKQLTNEEKARVAKFRCYVFSDDGTMKTRNWWHTNDLARSQTFDHTQMKRTSEGYYSGDNVSNTVYWRRVAGIGSKTIEGLDDDKIYDYFDLWNVLNVQGKTYIDEEGHEQTITDSTPGYDISYNDWPVAGDDVVQFGNAVDTDRQSLVVLEVTTGEPGMKVYNGVHDYNTVNCKWVGIGYDSTTKRAYADIFGDFYFGERGTTNPRNGGSYVRFNSSTKLLEIKAVINAQSRYSDDGKTINEKFEKAAQDYSKALAGEHDYATGAYDAAGNALSVGQGAQNSANDAQDTANGARSAAQAAQDKVNLLDSIKNALNGATLVDGGLLLTSLIGLRQYNGGDKGDINNYTTWGGINGVYQSGESVAAWFGGGISNAKILFRMNGSGYVANGKFNWDKDGNAKIAGFEIGNDTLGVEDYENGWAFFRRNGFFSVNRLNNNFDGYSAEIYGGGAICAKTDRTAKTSGNRVLVNDSGVNLRGTVNVGAQSNDNVNINGTVKINGYSPSTHTIIKGSGTKSLPNIYDVQEGHEVYAKGTTGDLTLTGVIMSSDSGETTTRVELGRASAKFVMMDNTWVHFRCD